MNPPDPSVYTLGLVGTPNQANVLRAVTGAGGSFSDAMTYDPDGSIISRTRNKTSNGFRTQALETYSYDAFNLVERFTKRKDAEPVAGGEGCVPDASTAPLDDWRYRFGPLQEREQKRQYATSQNQALSGLMWTYTLLGADAKQLASYNGIQGAFCGQPANTLWMWPVEYNSYGPAQTRIITRPQGAKEYVIADHLGSTRLTLNQTGDILERLDYQPFGKEINEAGDGARTSYIGREKDNESDLGFYGVRMYEPEYGRFMSVDALWGGRPELTAYAYASSNPISRVDEDGRWDIEVEFMKNVSRAEAPYGVATVRDIDGNAVMTFVVRGEGVGGRDRQKENSDTPQGEYSIDGWITPTKSERDAYGPNPRLALTGVSGEIEESGRSLIRVHGGRQEQKTEEGDFIPLKDPTLKPTHGCLRAFDPDVLRLKQITDKLTASNPDDKPGKLTVINSIPKKDDVVAGENNE
ncbi:MAG: hypothetical protein NTX15_11390 [Candidatus Kapabacteria bacterium]|nr:hypothetical protein [Candidatus Kapabacteria bacterium]